MLLLVRFYQTVSEYGAPTVLYFILLKIEKRNTVVVEILISVLLKKSFLRIAGYFLAH